MENFEKIIEEDDLDNFKTHFKLENWKDTIAQIENYAGTNEYIKEVTFNDADCLKYALHCNSDKIFNYLLPLVDTDKHGDNYGWPLLAMALKNRRYDYAHAIINHPEFNPYSMYHINVFSYIDSRPDIDKHIEFLFDYVEKFTRWDFKNERLLYDFTHLICHNEDTFNRFESIYKRKTNNPTASVLDLYENQMDILGTEIFNRKFNKFILDKLSTEYITEIIKSAFKNEVYFMELFESENAKEGLTYLLKCPKELNKYLENKKVLISYLPLECILLLMDNGIDIWSEDDKKTNAIDFILNNKDIKEEATWYFINNYPKEILERLQSKDRYKNIQTYCQQKLLQDELPRSSRKNSCAKI